MSSKLRLYTYIKEFHLILHQTRIDLNTLPHFKLAEFLDITTKLPHHEIFDLHLEVDRTRERETLF